MKYRLALYDKKNKEENKEVIDYSEMPAYSDLNETNLKNIVDFTSGFDDEVDLKLFLWETGLINTDDLTKEFSINKIDSKNNTRERLPYGISYKKDIKYFNIYYLMNRYDVIYQYDPEFMDRFLAKYKYLAKVNHDGKYPFKSDLMAIEYANENMKDYHCLPKEYTDELRSFIKKYCNYEKRNDDYYVEFARVRELAMFAISYERMKEKENVEVYAKTEEFKSEKIITYLKELLERKKSLLALNLKQDDKERLEKEADRLTKALKPFQK